jgi:SAM-dependent methyltransferase
VLRYSFDRFAVVVCPSCELTRLDPQPTAAELTAFYEDPRYFEGGLAVGEGYTEGYAERQACLRASAREDLELLARFRPHGDLLEVGCAFGDFLETAREWGYSVSGIDVSEAAVSESRRRVGCSVLRLTLSEYSALHPATADIVYGSHVIEHVPDPLEFAAALARVLRPGGLFLCVTPNQGSVLARISGRRWVSYKIPEHLFYFTPATLRRVLGSAFSVERVETAYQFYPLPLVADRLRRLLHPLSNIIPPLERWGPLARRNLRIPDGSMRVIARKVERN